MRLWLPVALAAALLGCEEREASYVWELPPGTAPPEAPEENPVTAAKVELGRHLFYDARLSANGQQACASCHIQALGFSEPKPVSIGSTGEALPRNAQGLANAGYFSALTWSNPLMSALERQVVVPMFSDAPVELGLAGREDELFARLRADERYQRLFSEAFPGEEDPFTVKSVVRALSSFVRTMVSFDAPLDRWRRGEEGALSPAADRGRELFFSERLGCADCHAGPHLSVATLPDATEEEIYVNTGLYDLDGAGAYPATAPGLYELTGEPADMGRFRVPSLRNVAVTAPYMHDGSVATLEEVLEIYEAGGRGPGRDSPLKDPRVGGFALTEGERADLLSFFSALTDESFLADPRLSDPFSP